MENQESLIDNQLVLNSEGKDNLVRAGKWAKFIGIINFIFAGFIILGILFLFVAGSSLISKIGGGGTIIMLGMIMVYIAIAILYFFIGRSLYRFGKEAKNAVDSGDETSLSMSLASLKSFFTIIGILILIVICVYGIALIFAVVAHFTKL